MKRIVARLRGLPGVELYKCVMLTIIVVLLAKQTFGVSTVQGDVTIDGAVAVEGEVGIVGTVDVEGTVDASGSTVILER